MLSRFSMLPVGRVQRLRERRLQDHAARPGRGSASGPGSISGRPMAGSRRPIARSSTGCLALSWTTVAAAARYGPATAGDRRDPGAQRRDVGARRQPEPDLRTPGLPRTGPATGWWRPAAAPPTAAARSPRRPRRRPRPGPGRGRARRSARIQRSVARHAVSPAAAARPAGSPPTGPRAARRAHARRRRPPCRRTG